jgi:hypothetical protein
MQSMPSMPWNHAIRTTLLDLTAGPGRIRFTA